MRKLQFILASCTLVLSLAYAIAGVEVINFPVGESLHSGPNAVLLKQLQVRDASPASGSVTIGEITAKWETETFDSWIVTNIIEGNVDSVVIVPWEKGKVSYGEVFDWTYEWDEGFFGLIYTNGNWKISYNVNDGLFDFPEDTLKIVVVDEYTSYTGIFSRASSAPIVIPHATTNALWTVTAAGGNAVTNFPANSYEYLKPGIDWVRYGTATGGFVRLFVED